MGTPDFSVGALQEIVKAGHEVVLVVTQPDKVRGRGGNVSYTPVKQCALDLGIEVFQPARIRDEEAVRRLKEADADIFVVAAFGQILSEEILNMPKYGCINIHASLLPAYRGAAPIQWCILKGEKQTGITIMQMDKGVDTGDILMQKTIDIAEDETGDSLFDKLASLGAATITQALTDIENGRLKPVPQDDSKSTHVGMLRKEMGLIDWNKDAATIERYVRGLNSWPGAYTYYNGKLLKIWGAAVSGPEDNKEAPGTVIKADAEGLTISTGRGTLIIKDLQLEGRKRMNVKAFLLGNPLKAGEILG